MTGRITYVKKVFHRNLINIINSYHPKISYYVSKIQDYTKNIFNESVIELIDDNVNVITNRNIYDDIYKFIKQIYQKYKIL